MCTHGWRSEHHTAPHPDIVRIEWLERIRNEEGILQHGAATWPEILDGALAKELLRALNQPDG